MMSSFVCFSRVLNVQLETSDLTNELPAESDLLPTVCLDNLKGSVGLILAKASTMRISIPLDFSSRSFIPLSRFIHSRHPTPILVPPSSFFFRVLTKWYMLDV